MDNNIIKRCVLSKDVRNSLKFMQTLKDIPDVQPEIAQNSQNGIKNNVHLKDAQNILKFMPILKDILDVQPEIALNSTLGIIIPMVTNNISHKENVENVVLENFDNLMLILNLIILN